MGGFANWCAKWRIAMMAIRVLPWPVPRLPVVLMVGSSGKIQRTYYKKSAKCAEFTDRLGLGRKHIKPDIQFF